MKISMANEFGRKGGGGVGKRLLGREEGGGNSKRLLFDHRCVWVGLSLSVVCTYITLIHLGAPRHFL